MFLYINYRSRNKLNIRNEKVSYMPNEYICISFFNECLYTQILASNMCYAYFMPIINISEYFLQNDDAVSCVTGVTGKIDLHLSLKIEEVIYQIVLDIQWRKRRLNARGKVQLLIFPISKNVWTQVSTTRSNGWTLLMITLINILGVVLRLIWVSMQGIK